MDNKFLTKFFILAIIIMALGINTVLITFVVNNFLLPFDSRIEQEYIKNSVKENEEYINKFEKIKTRISKNEEVADENNEKEEELNLDVESKVDLVNDIFEY